jgi:hypothetical protein
MVTIREEQPLFLAEPAGVVYPDRRKFVRKNVLPIS